VVVEVMGAGGGADWTSVELVLAGCEQPASRADPASNTMPSVTRKVDFVAVIFHTPKRGW